jgi:hypothetical protein
MIMSVPILVQLVALQHCWSISTGSCLTTLLTALISLRVTTVLPTLGSQLSNNKEELMKGVKIYLSSQAEVFSDTGIHKLIPNICASVPVLTKLTSSLSMHVCFDVIKYYIIACYFLNSTPIYFSVICMDA